MKAYTLGFIFNKGFSDVLLMHKNRPEWQVGKLNGVGGKIEEGEDSAEGMVREVWEETGVRTDKEDWNYFGEIKGKGWRVDLYALVYAGAVDDFSAATDEKIEWFEVNNLPDNILGNLAWMIPLAIDVLENKEIESCLVEYR